MIFMLVFQVISSLFTDALLLGVLFTRLSRGGKRGESFTYSDRAIIAEHGGEQYLLFQVFDKRRDALVEASIRCFCYIHHDFGGRSFPHHRAMKLAQPDPDDGGVLLCCSPTLVAHRLGPSSPIFAAAALEGFSRGDGKPLDVSKLEAALSRLSHFEIVVEVNGVENVTNAQVQSRWSFLASEIDSDEVEGPDWETPCVTIQGGLAHVHRTSVALWRNALNPGDVSLLSASGPFAFPHASSNDSGRVSVKGQLACALAFQLPAAASCEQHEPAFSGPFHP